MRRRNLHRWHRLVFARQLLFALPLLTDLPVGDCIMPLLAAVNALKGPFSELWLETADTYEAKELSGLIKKFEKPFRSVLEKAGKLPRNKLELPRLHLFFLGSARLPLTSPFRSPETPRPGRSASHACACRAPRRRARR